MRECVFLAREWMSIPKDGDNGGDDEKAALSSIDCFVRQDMVFHYSFRTVF